MRPKAVILVIEDDPEIQELLSFALSKEGWKTIPARTGEQGLERAQREPCDCILLDIMLPGMDGLKTLKKLRESCRTAPVIITTAKGEEADIVAGLELGADDYVVKPYSPRVLVARIRAALRRQEEGGGTEKPTCWEEGALRLDAARHEAFCGGKRVDLLATEFALLQHFLSCPGRVFSRGQIIQAIRGPGYPVTDRAVDVQILGLRKKLGEAGGMIETVRGVGYRLRTDE
ncbi:MAG: response regulator transcription factor [Spirochaetaceae bacterium]|jgi:two-component system phosphate regulon response regulator PhoB|nr:response regulator transcription factor [Spirochaetaceae bacterium]